MPLDIERVVKEYAEEILPEMINTTVETVLIEENVAVTSLIDTSEEEHFVLQRKSINLQDILQAQKEDVSIATIMKLIEQRRQPSAKQKREMNIDVKLLLKEWSRQILNQIVWIKIMKKVETVLR